MAEAKVALAEAEPVSSRSRNARKRTLKVVPGPDFRVAKNRNVWVGNGRAHIEIRGGRHPNAHHLLADVEDAVGKVKGVKWARTIAMVGQLVVSFEGESLDLDELFESVDSLESTHEVDISAEYREHPGDSSPIGRNLTLIGADLVSLALSPFGRILDAIPFSIEFASLVSVAESSERIRRFVDRRLGVAGIVSMATAGAVVQGLTQGPLGLVVDIAHRAGTIGEVRARNATWASREHELADGLPQLPRVVHEHVRPSQRGVAERYADISVLGSLAVSVGVGALTRSPRRAAGVMIAGIPKAALRGHEAFAAEAGRRMARRGAVVMDYTFFRRLDRIDTVVFEAPPTPGDRATLDELVGAAQRGGLRIEKDVAGTDLAATVRELHDQGCVAMLVSFGHHNAFRAAHASIGILHDSHHVPWGADIIVGPDHGEVAAMLASCSTARWSSRVGVALSALGTGAGVAAALTTPLPLSVRLPALPMNAAALASMTWGVGAATVASRRYRHV